MCISAQDIKKVLPKVSKHNQHFFPGLRAGIKMFPQPLMVSGMISRGDTTPVMAHYSLQ